MRDRSLGYRVILFVILAIAVISISISVFTLYQQPTFAYVRTEFLVDNYLGTKEATKKMDLLKGEWQANIDTLSANLESNIATYNREQSSYSANQRKAWQENMSAQKLQLSKYTEAIGQKAAEEEEKLMQSVLYQINSFVEKYGKEKKYDIILGTTLSGNIMYGDKGKDITDQLLTELNAYYTGKNQSKN